MLKYCLQYKK